MDRPKADGQDGKKARSKVASIRIEMSKERDMPEQPGLNK
jgi:hypothetical protein